MEINIIVQNVLWSSYSLQIHLILLVLLSAILKIKGLKKSPLPCALILESRLKNWRNITDILLIGVMNMIT